MANVVTNLFRAVWSFILGSLRLILFFSCLLFALIEILTISLLVFKNNSPNNFGLPGSDWESGGLVGSIWLLALALLGCYGSFYKHHASLKWFSTLMAVFIVLNVVFLIFTISSGALEKETGTFFKQMEDLLDKYDWSGSKQNEATIRWNGIQKLRCCGIKGPADWRKFQPSPDLFPSTCCDSGQFSQKLCSQDDVYEEGCLVRIQQVLAVAVFCSCMGIIFLFLLTVIAAVVSSLNFENRTGQQATTHRGNNTSSDYTRFEGSVYVRQPAVNEAYVGPQKMPSLYPNAYDLEKAGPPPSYGSSK